MHVLEESSKKLSGLYQIQLVKEVRPKIECLDINYAN
jgi:hypothetical protein